MPIFGGRWPALGLSVAFAPTSAVPLAAAHTLARNAVYVAVDPVVVGTVTVTGDVSDLVITNLAVHPSRQGSGVGRAMMRFAEQLAADGGYRRVTLFTHELMVENISFYVALGYTETGRRVTDGRSRVYFVRPVSP